jgi:hypothetical protein
MRLPLLVVLSLNALTCPSRSTRAPVERAARSAALRAPIRRAISRYCSRGWPER